MSFLGDAMKTVESVILLRSKVEQLDTELGRTNDEIRKVTNAVTQIDRRLVRLEVYEEMRSGNKTPPKIIDQ